MKRLPAIALGVLLLAGCTPDSTSAPTVSSAAPESATSSASATPGATQAASGSALEALATLPVKPKASVRYDRVGQFGKSWLDVDGNGCSTRDDILASSMTDVKRDGCAVLSGVLQDPYTGKQIKFKRGVDTSLESQIDHVIPLSWAARTGALDLSQEERVAMANDPLNLIATDGPTNQEKSDKDASEWLPPQEGFHCQYVARQVAVKVRYKLWVTQSEHDAIADVLASCPLEPLPTGGLTVTPPIPVQVPSQVIDDTPEAANITGLDERLGSCSAVEDAGLGPYEKGVDPEYDWYKDGDRDGTVCE